MERTYRVELSINGKRPSVFGYFHTTLDKIRRAMEGQLKFKQSTVYVYYKTGKVILDKFEG